MPNNNEIPFFVDTNITGRSNSSSSHTKPKVFPSFVLAFNSAWNDYDVKSEFALYYYPSHGRVKYIGDVKIMTIDEEDIEKVIPKKFKTLKEKFCSVGQRKEFYVNLKTELETEFENVLSALRNAAFDTEIKQRFERKTYYKGSLIRYHDVERLTRTIKYEIYGYDLTKLYQFQYVLKPVYTTDAKTIDFNFENTGELPSRVYAVIGKNGTGKTQFISSLPLSIARRETHRIKPKIPLFSKIIAVSYSAFDKFEIPRKTENFNYVYCGLRKNKRRLFSESELLARFNISCDEVEKYDRVKQWHDILSNFLHEDILEDMIYEEDTINLNDKDAVLLKINRQFHVGRLSSGQTIILYIITEIIANIYLDSLILFDEPETHLHPNAISQLINTIQSLVEKFESYCIITTHSPIIIREIFSKNVYVIEREADNFSLNRIGLESFGENLGTLTEKVFGTQAVPKHYKKVIKKLYQKGMDFEEIVELLQFDEVPLSLNLMLFIKSQENEES